MKLFRGRRDDPQQRQPHHGQHDRHLQKVDMIFSNLEADTTDSDSTESAALQTSPLPFQQSQSACPDMDGVYGYTTLAALRDDLRVYFEIIHGKPPPPSDQSQQSSSSSTPGTAIPPPLFGTTVAASTTAGTAGTSTAGTGSTMIATGATATATTAGGTSMAFVVSTTAASGTVTDIAVTTATTATASPPSLSSNITTVVAAGTATAMSPAARMGVRKRIRHHLHGDDRRMQKEADAAVFNETVVASNMTATNSFVNSTLENVTGTLVEDMAMDDNTTSTLETIGGENATLTVEDGENATLTMDDGENATLTINDDNATLTLEDGNATLTLEDGNATLTLDGENATLTINDDNATLTLDSENATLAINDENATLTINDDNATLTLDSENSTLTLDDENATGTALENNNITSDNATEWDANLTTTSLSTITFANDSAVNDTFATVIDSTPAANPNLSVDFEIEPSIPIQFNVCPGVFNFESASSGNAAPIIIETLTWNPVWIRCLDNVVASDGNDSRNLVDSSCIFSGGDVHMLFNNYGSESSSSANATQDQEPAYHPLTITGIAFQGASQASVSMHDPRGEIVFEDCQWEGMTGAAMVIDGRYAGTHVAGSSTLGTGTSGGGGGGSNESRTTDPAEDDFLQQFYQDIATPAPFTANPSPAPNSEPTTDAPNTPFPTTVLRIPASPTVSPQPTMEANVLDPPPEGGGYTGPPTLTSSVVENITETYSTEGSFLLPTTVGSGTTAFVDSSTTWHGTIESTSTTYSTAFGAVVETGGTDNDDGQTDDDGGQTDDAGQTNDDGGQTTDDGVVNTDDGGQDDGSYNDDFAPRLLELDSLSFDVETDETRSLKVDIIPKSIIKIRSCSFRANTGPATIILTSQHDKMVTKDAGVLAQNDDIFDARAGNVPMAHSIHLALEDSTFDSDNVKGSVIVNDGGRLQASNCMFSSNTADSIIQVESGTLAMSRTEFARNTITGETGLVAIDGGSSVESNDNNCDTTSSSSAVESDVAMDTLVSSRFLQDNATDFGNVTMENETALLTVTGASDVNATITSSSIAGASMLATATSTSDINPTESEINLMDNSTEGVLSPSLAPPDSTACAGIFTNGICRKFDSACKVEEDEMLDESVAGCLSSWDDLVTAVRERLDDERDFMICPHSTMDIESSTAKAPVVIDSDYITIKCGADGSVSDECSIVGGISQFYVVGTSSGVELAGLRMISSTGSSIIAAGTKEATLHLKNCEWASHTGESVILLKSESLTGAIEDALDINELMSTTDGSAMSVEITDCIFRVCFFLLELTTFRFSIILQLVVLHFIVLYS
eukprot:CCRYP_003674-RB/>CCRYP_003674-RB protein AED:0.04 eAED:0.04 QI:199/1/1/1/0.8/0.5/6/2230/1315